MNSLKSHSFSRARKSRGIPVISLSIKNLKLKFLVELKADQTQQEGIRHGDGPTERRAGVNKL